MQQPLPTAALARELRPYLDLVNQVFEVEKKATALTESNSILRNVRNMRSWLEREVRVSMNGQPAIASFTFHNPLGESYDETRSDCDASIAGAGAKDLVITEVIKPIIWFTAAGAPKVIVQQAVVIVESKSTDNLSVDETATSVADTPMALTPGASYVFKTTSEPEALDNTGQQSAPTTPEQNPETPTQNSVA